MYRNMLDEEMEDGVRAAWVGRAALLHPVGWTTRRLTLSLCLLSQDFRSSGSSSNPVGRFMRKMSGKSLVARQRPHVRQSHKHADADWCPSARDQAPSTPSPSASGCFSTESEYPQRRSYEARQGAWAECPWP